MPRLVIEALTVEPPSTRGAHPSLRARCVLPTESMPIDFVIPEEQAQWFQSQQAVLVSLVPEDQFCSVLCWDCEATITADGDCPKCRVCYGGGPCSSCNQSGLHANDCPEIHGPANDTRY